MTTGIMSWLLPVPEHKKDYIFRHGGLAEEVRELIGNSKMKFQLS